MDAFSFAASGEVDALGHDVARINAISISRVG
jgi:hypothetical protein